MSLSWRRKGSKDEEESYLFLSPNSWSTTCKLNTRASGGHLGLPSFPGSEAESAPAPARKMDMAS